MKKQLVTEAKRLQELAGILNENSTIDIPAIKREMQDFYGIDISEEDISDWLQSYHYDRIEDDEDYDGEFVFDTGEREDLYTHLEDQGLI
jgi:hypothetical protein